MCPAKGIFTMEDWNFELPPLLLAAIFPKFLMNLRSSTTRLLNLCSDSQFCSDCCQQILIALRSSFSKLTSRPELLTILHSTLPLLHSSHTSSLHAPANSTMEPRHQNDALIPMIQQRNELEFLYIESEKMGYNEREEELPN